MASSSPPTSLTSSSHFIGQISSPRPSPPPSPTSVSFRQLRVSASFTSTRTAPPTLMAAPTTSPSSLYDLLGISKAASNQEIKAAYRKLARVCHPDVVTFDRKDASAEEFLKIHNAYSTLSDPKKRADYDRTLFTRQRSFNSPYAKSPSTSPMSGFTGRNWETDQCW